MGERAGIVLGAHPVAVLQHVALGEHVGRAVDLDQGVGFAARETEDPARPVIFERTREERDTVRGERAGDGVAGKAAIGAALEREGQRPLAIDVFACTRGQARGLVPHDALPSPAGCCSLGSPIR